MCLLTLGFQGAGAKFNFEDTKHNFGMIRQGEIANFEYKFENTGTEPLVISDSKVECSCTKVTLPSQPVKPGEKSSIKVAFDSKSAIDRQERTITIISNAGGNTVLRFKGVVLKKKE